MYKFMFMYVLYVNIDVYLYIYISVCVCLYVCVCADFTQVCVYVQNWIVCTCICTNLYDIEYFVYIQV